MFFSSSAKWLVHLTQGSVQFVSVQQVIAGARTGNIFWGWKSQNKLPNLKKVGSPVSHTHIRYINKYTYSNSDVVQYYMSLYFKAKSNCHKLHCFLDFSWNSVAPVKASIWKSNLGFHLLLTCSVLKNANAFHLVHTRTSTISHSSKVWKLARDLQSRIDLHAHAVHRCFLVEQFTPWPNFYLGKAQTSTRVLPCSSPF